MPETPDKRFAPWEIALYQDFMKSPQGTALLNTLDDISYYNIPRGHNGYRDAYLGNKISESVTSHFQDFYREYREKTIARMASTRN
jgi:hypothetical protein